MPNLATNVRWTDQNPAIYFDLDYEISASGNDLKFRWIITVHPLTAGSFGKPICAYYQLDTLLQGSVQFKNTNPSTWSENIVYTCPWDTLQGRASDGKQTSFKFTLHDTPNDPDIGRTGTYNYIIPAYHAGSTITADDGQIGQPLQIAVTKPASNTCTISYSIGNKSGTIVNKTALSNITWNIPADLVTEIRNATSGFCTITCKTFSGSTQMSEESVIVELSVPDATVPVLNSSSYDIGGTMVVTLPRAVPQYEHSLSLRLQSEMISMGRYGSQCTYIIPDTFLSRFASDTQITARVQVRTYNGAAEVGTILTEPFTINVPNIDRYKPVITTFTVAPSSVTPGFEGLFIQKITRLGVTVDGTTDYSEIASHSAKCGSEEISSPGSSSYPVTFRVPLQESGTVTVYGKLTDKRGLFTQTSQDITVIPYSMPAILPYTGDTAIVCYRCNAQGVADSTGTYLKIKAKREFSKVMANSVQKNFCRMYIRYKKVTDTTYTEQTILAADASSDAVDTILSGIVTDSSAAYNVEIWVKDTLNNSAKQAFLVSGDIYTLHLGDGGKKAAFFKKAELEGTLEVAGDERIYGNLELDGLLSLKGLPELQEIPSSWLNNCTVASGGYAILGRLVIIDVELVVSSSFNSGGDIAISLPYQMLPAIGKNQKISVMSDNLSNHYNAYLGGISIWLIPDAGKTIPANEHVYISCMYLMYRI